MIELDNIHSHNILFLPFSKYMWNEIPVNKSSRISAINRITNFSCVNPSRRNIRTHGIWIYDALLNQGFVIVLFKQTDILDYISSDGKHYDNYVSNYEVYIYGIQHCKIKTAISSVLTYTINESLRLIYIIRFLTKISKNGQQYFQSGEKISGAARCTKRERNVNIWQSIYCNIDSCWYRCAQNKYYKTILGSVLWIFVNR